MSQYQDSLGKSRAAISAQLQAAMSDINGNEQRAGTVISGLPAQYGAQYGAAQGSLQNAAATLDAHQQAGGGGSQTGYSKDWLAPEQQALTGTLTALQAQVPELQLAAQSEFANRRGQAQSIAGEQTSALDSSQRDAMMRSQEQQAGFAHDLQMEQMRQGASGGSPGSAQWWATQRSVNPQDTNALEGRAMSNGFVNDFSNWSPAKQSQYIGSGVPSPPMQSFLQYLAANNAATASKKAKPPGRR